MNQNNAIIIKESPLISRTQTQGGTITSKLSQHKLETGSKNPRASEPFIRKTPQSQVSKSLIHFPSPNPETPLPKPAHHRQKFPAYDLGMSVGHEQPWEMQLMSEEERPSLTLSYKNKDKPKIPNFNPFEIPDCKLKLNGYSSKDTLSKQHPKRASLLSAGMVSPSKVKSSQTQIFSIPNRGPSPYGHRKTLDNCPTSMDFSNILDKRVTVCCLDTTPEKFINKLPVGSPER